MKLLTAEMDQKEDKSCTGEGGVGKLCQIASSVTGAMVIPDPATARQQLPCPTLGKLARPWRGHRTANPLINFAMRLMMMDSCTDLGSEVSRLLPASLPAPKIMVSPHTRLCF